VIGKSGHDAHPDVIDLDPEVLAEAAVEISIDCDGHPSCSGTGTVDEDRLALRAGVVAGLLPAITVDELLVVELVAEILDVCSRLEDLVRARHRRRARTIGR
jgi:hypothetical protein